MLGLSHEYTMARRNEIVPSTQWCWRWILPGAPAARQDDTAIGRAVTDRTAFVEHTSSPGPP
jgi:hypothetical protein